MQLAYAIAYPCFRLSWIVRHAVGDVPSIGLGFGDVPYNGNVIYAPVGFHIFNIF